MNLPMFSNNSPKLIKGGVTRLLILLQDYKITDYDFVIEKEKECEEVLNWIHGIETHLDL